MAAFEFLRRKGVVDEVGGKVKERIGDLTDNPELQAKGLVQQGKGKARRTVEDVKEAVSDTVDDIKETFEDMNEEGDIQ
ncbi:hypothetical protein AOC36_02410 [Erysipelothrix larvae]|uniref:CsbD-like domain-containing protein n=1 Tax=Erysipelothrix larvae TaxID=1514105 RepID=A0A109UHR5_9FIRM|nr:hypothetical protein AOC36_02410 [Erysipelothrix larvae]